MKKLATLLFLFVFTSFTFGQTEKLNQLDNDGKKHGKWIAYLDRNWKYINDSTKAVYYKYTYYDHGTNLYPMGPCGRKHYKLEPVIDSKQKITLLDGEYKWYNSKGQLSSVHVFKNGEYISCKEYYSSGKISQYFDYTKKWKEQPLTWYMESYDKNGKIKLSLYFKPDDKGKYPTTQG